MSATKEQIDKAKHDAKNALPSDNPNALAVQDCIILYDALTAPSETAALRDLVRRMREAGTWKQDSEAWFTLCAEADKVLGD